MTDKKPGRPPNPRKLKTVTVMIFLDQWEKRLTSAWIRDAIDQKLQNEIVKEQNAKTSENHTES